MVYVNRNHYLEVLNPIIVEVASLLSWPHIGPASINCGQNPAYHTLLLMSIGGNQIQLRKNGTRILRNISNYLV